jgi:hypothetical protein
VEAQQRKPSQRGTIPKATQGLQKKKKRDLCLKKETNKALFQSTTITLYIYNVYTITFSFFFFCNNDTRE